MKRGLSLLVAAVALSGCFSAASPEVAHLRVIAEPKSTTVYIDDVYVGSARVLAEHPQALKPGTKYVTFKAPDYFPHDVKLELPAGETPVQMKLRPIPR